MEGRGGKSGPGRLRWAERVDALRALKHAMDERYGLLSRLAQYCVVGASGMVIDLLVYRTLLARDWPMEVGRALAIGSAMTWNFWLNRRLTFGYSRGAPVLPQYLRFVVTCSLGALVSWSVSLGLARGAEPLRGHPLWAALVGILCGTAVNFLISLRWVFRGAPQPGGNAP